MSEHCCFMSNDYQQCMEAATWHVGLRESDDNGGQYEAAHVGPACDEHLPHVLYFAGEDLLAEMRADGRRHAWSVTVEPRIGPYASASAALDWQMSHP